MFNINNNYNFKNNSNYIKLRKYIWTTTKKNLPIHAIYCQDTIEMRNSLYLE